MRYYVPNLRATKDVNSRQKETTKNKKKEVSQYTFL